MPKAANAHTPPAVAGSSGKSRKLSSRTIAKRRWAIPVHQIGLGPNDPTPANVVRLPPRAVLEMFGMSPAFTAFALVAHRLTPEQAREVAGELTLIAELLPAAFTSTAIEVLGMVK